MKELGLFRSPVEGARQGKTVLVQLRDATDPETGQRYTVRRGKNEWARREGSWRHEETALEPVNADLETIAIASTNDSDLQVVVEPLGG